MSLNFREIDLVLSELDLAGSQIQKVLQPSYDTIVFELFGPGSRGPRRLLISVAAGACRIHFLGEAPAKNERPLRFMECLRSRIRNGRIESVGQLGADRIVKFTIVSGLSAESGASRHYLYARLWSGAGNIILTDGEGTIVDALFRKPEKGESSGMPCVLESALTEMDPASRALMELKFTVRDLPGDGSFSERVESFYREKSGGISRENLLKAARERFAKRSRMLDMREAELAALMKTCENAERFMQIGNLLMAEHGASGGLFETGPSGSPFIRVSDFYTGEEVSVQIDPAHDLAWNARAYFERYHKSLSGKDDTERELARVGESRKELAAWLAGIEEETDPFAMARQLEKAGTVREKPKRAFPCLCVEDGEWTMLVGRSAKENDELLRKHVQGSDLWLHARNHSGSYVFVKCRKGKTVPLEIMLDAAMLAVYYSKARKNQEGDVYYTQAKNLKRVKGGPRGLVIPFMEKNLFVRLDEASIKRLLSGSSGGHE